MSNRKRGTTRKQKLIKKAEYQEPLMEIAPLSTVVQMCVNIFSVSVL